MRGAILFLALFPTLLFSFQSKLSFEPESFIPNEPWFTGPLFAASSTNADPGHPSILANFSFLDIYGEYDSSWKFQNQKEVWGLTLLLDLDFAITKRTGIEIFGAATTRIDDEGSDTDLDDTFLLLGYQVSTDTKDSRVPDCRFYIQLIFPSGKYDQLDPTDQRAIAVTGQGAYFIGPAISCQKLFQYSKHFFLFHWGLTYNFPSKAEVKDFSVYGGGIGTKGKIRPGQFLQAFISLEYSLNQNWAVATDFFVTYQTKTSRFKGRRGFTLDGKAAEIGLPSSTQVSITPSIEYSTSPQFGCLFGAWLTIAGRNASAFAGGFVQFGYVF